MTLTPVEILNYEYFSFQFNNNNKKKILFSSKNTNSQGMYQMVYLCYFFKKNKNKNTVYRNILGPFSNAPHMIA